MPARFVSILGLVGVVAAPAIAAPNQKVASSIFQEAKLISDRDGGQFWGEKLYGPILLVDPSDQTAVANEPDVGGTLKPSGTVFSGILPSSVTISDTPIEWSDKRWTELMLPLQPKSDKRTDVGNDWRAVLLAHEMFHRIQPALGLTRPEVANVHLDTLAGRYLLQLEWRALASALTSYDQKSRRVAVSDALMFRRERYRLFPEAATSEAGLEIDEGIPEYTGVRLGLKTKKAQTRYAVYDLSAFVDAPTFVRAFAYATGPAYGLLLDTADSSWRGKLNSGQRLDQLLESAMALQTWNYADLKAREAVYDPGGGLYVAEVKRDEARREHQAVMKASLVDGHVLRLPLNHANYGFNPQTLQALEGYGVVYPTLHLSDEWGVLQVDTGGALMDKRVTVAVVPLNGNDPSHITGNGWHLTLKQGWVVEPGSRDGDFQVIKRGNSPN